MDPGILNLAPGLLHGMSGAWDFSTLPPEECHPQVIDKALNAIFPFQLIFGEIVKFPLICSSM